MANTLTRKEDRGRMPAQKPNDGERAAQANYVIPLVNIAETKDGYELQAEMPGVSKSGLEILLEGNELTIVGHRDDSAISGAMLLHRESRPAGFRRVFELDPAIDTQNIRARMENGVLHLTLPRAEKLKPRKIAVGD